MADEKNICKYKLYVWRNVMEDYTPGIAFTIAKNKKHAISNLLKEYDKSVYALENNLITKDNFYKFSDGGTWGIIRDIDARNIFLEELLTNKPIVYSVDRPMAKFQGGGS